MTITTGERLTIKSTKLSPVALPIIMLGGSPISVAVPPILAMSISVYIKGKGLVFSVSVITRVTGTTSKMVVTLSKKAEDKAVIMENKTRIFHGSPLAFLAAAIAKYSKIPVLFKILTIIIIPTSKPIVLKSICLIAAF